MTDQSDKNSQSNSYLIEKFISNFSDAIDTFTNGCCYYFAKILEMRFGAMIYYDEVDNHFVGKINDKFYDVTGEVPDNGYVPWCTYEQVDALNFQRVVRDCILKIGD